MSLDERDVFNKIICMLQSSGEVLNITKEDENWNAEEVYFALDKYILIKKEKYLLGLMDKKTMVGFS